MRKYNAELCTLILSEGVAMKMKAMLTRLITENDTCHARSLTPAPRFALPSRKWGEQSEGGGARQTIRYANLR